MENNGNQFFLNYYLCFFLEYGVLTQIFHMTNDTADNSNNETAYQEIQITTANENNLNNVVVEQQQSINSNENGNRFCIMVLILKI